MYVRCAGKPDGLAKVSEIRELGPECDLVVLAWYYPRDGIEEELRGPRKVPKNRQAHLDVHWPANAQFDYMLSSNRTINMFNTLRRKAPMAKVCLDKYYVTTEIIRKICNARNPNYKWMEKLLRLKAKKGGCLRSDSCLIPGADTMSDIQPSAAPESPRNPKPRVSSLLIPSLPLREETLTNADGVSTTFNQPTIEPSSVAPNIPETTQEDIGFWDDIDFSSKSALLDRRLHADRITN